MAPRSRWWHQLQSSKKEALLAIDLYNRSGHERQLEAFIVYMSMAWLRLMQAKTEMGGSDRHLCILNDRGHRRRHPDGGWSVKGLHELTTELMQETDPRRLNLQFFTGLRNVVEHRYEKDVTSLVAGRTQAYVLNYESALRE